LQASKDFFFVNKKEAKKLYLPWDLALKVPTPPRTESFLLLFFKKEALSYLFGF